MRSRLALLLLLTFLVYGTALGQSTIVPPNAKNGWPLESFNTPLSQFGPPHLNTEWELGDGRTVAVHVHGPLLARQWIMTLADANTDPPTITAFNLPLGSRGFSCACGAFIEVISWTMLTDSMGELVLRHSWSHRMMYRIHELCTETCGEYVVKELVYYVDVTGPIRCLACDIPRSVRREIWVPEHGVVKTSAYEIGLVHAGNVLSVRPQTEELYRDQLPWPGDYELAF